MDRCLARLYGLGYTSEGAFSALQDATEAYIEDMVESGEDIPEGIC